MKRSLKRISEMENYLDECIEFNAELSLQLEELDEAKERFEKLFRYYGSEDWYKDREEELPEGMKAGVLSEDLVYEEIAKLRENAIHMLESATDILKNRL